MSEGDVRPDPDPTARTNEAVKEAVAAAKDYTDAVKDLLEERLRGIDRATIVLNETIHRVPTDVQKEISHLRELMDAFRDMTMMQFTGIENWRKEQKADTEKGVQSALSAAKEAVKEQTTASQLSTNKSETATTEQIKQLTVTFNVAIAGQGSSISDLKERIGSLENLKQGGQDTSARLLAGVLAVVAVLSLAFAVARSFQ